jgi:hypothetical protein
MEASSRISKRATFALLCALAFSTIAGVRSLESSPRTALAPAAAFPFSYWKSASAPTPTPTATPDPNPITRTYVSGGDTNGVFYFAGQNFSTAGTWTNPHTAGRVVIVRSSDGVGTATHIVDRASQDTYTTNAANSWISADLGSSRTLIVSKYWVKLRNVSDPRALRNWKLQGTNSSAGNSVAQLAAATWTDLDTHVSDTTIPNTSGANSVFTVSPTPSAYRWIRILQNGLNGGAGPDNYLALDEIELYGVFAY